MLVYDYSQWSKPEYNSPYEYILPISFNTVYNGHVTIEALTSSLWYLCFIYLTESKISIFIRPYDGNSTVHFYYLYIIGI